MGYALVCAGEVLAFLKKNNKIVLFILVSMAWVVFAFNTDNPDLPNYQRQYYGLATYYTEPLYVLLQNICIRQGLSFFAFLRVEAALGLIVMAIVFCMLSPYPNAVYGLYMIYPFFADIVQVRSFFAQAFVLLALTQLIKYKSDKKTLRIIAFFAVFIIAMGFHYSAILFAPLFCLFLRTDKHKILLFIIIPLAIMTIPFWIKLLSPMIAQMIGEKKAAAWISFNVTISLLGVLKRLAIRMLIPAIILLAWVIVYPPNGRRMLIADDAMSPPDAAVVNYEGNVTILLAIIYLFMFVSMELSMDSQYNRIARTNIIFEYILLSRLIELTGSKSNKKVLWILLIISTVIFTADVLFFRTVDEVNQTWFTFVFRRVFEENSLWTMLLE